MMSYFKTTLLGAALLAAPLFATSLSAYDLYWTEYQNSSPVIMAADIDGQNAVPIVSNVGMVSYAVDIALTDTHMYWTGHNGGDVWSANLDGTDPQRIIEDGNGLVLVHNLTIDESSGTIYLADSTNGIFSANLDGSNLTNIWNTNPVSYSGIALRNPNELLWLTTANPYLYIQSVPGSNQPGAVELEGGDTNYGLAYDAPTDTAYYTNYTSGTLHSYNLTTNEQKLLRQDLVQPLGIKLSPSGTHLLIAERGRGISAFQVDNYGYALIVDSADAHFGVATLADPADLPPGTPPPLPPGPAEDGDVIFQADFQSDTLGVAPLLLADNGVWTEWDKYSTPEALYVAQDANDMFGYGTDNQFFRIDNAVGSSLEGVFSDSVEVATLSFDAILYRTSNDSSGSERNGIAFWGDSGRLHILSIDHLGRIRGGTSGGPRIPQYQRARIDVVYNKSASEITYDDPDGGLQTLAAATVDVWLDGTLIDTYGEFGVAGTGPLTMIRLPHFSSTDRYSMDMDNITVFKGAHVFQPIVEGVVPDRNPPPTFFGYLNADFDGIPLGEIIEGNRADYMHGNISSFSFGSKYGDSPLLIAEDSENHFGKGAGNQVLRTNGAAHWTINAQNNFNQEVMTLRLDMMAGTASNSRLTTRFFDAEGDSVSRADLRANPGTESGTFDANGGSWEYDVVNRFEIVANNSAEAITYEKPKGGMKTLVAGGTDVWVNGRLQVSDTLDSRTTTTYGPIMAYELRTFSTNPWSADIDLVQTYEGVHLVPVEAGPGYAAWVEDSFDPSEQADSAISGPSADPDGDGIANLLEYFLGLNPKVASTAGVPVSAVTAIEVGGVENDYLTLTFTADDESSDVDHQVEVSGELSSWAAEAVLVSSEIHSGGTTTYVYRDSEPVSSNNRRFLRLSVSQ